ncbi:MAG TPA: amidohydrolase family protein [Bryobacteraceae bacterium]|nr:amidohydrolase family protein [Bryobacteraceae bacterium]
MFRNAALAFSLVTALVPLHAEVKVLKNFTLFDGTGKPPMASAAMIVNDGRIQWVGPVASLKAPAGAETIDLTGRFVMPGIINLHGHVGNVVGLTQDPKFFTRQNIEKDLRTYASYGVTTVLSLGTDQDLIFKIRDEQRATGRPTETRIYSAGQGFTAKGAYGGLPGVTYFLTNVNEIPKDVADQAAKHVDIIKLWCDDHMHHLKKLPFEYSKAIIDSARQHHLHVAAHIFYLSDAKQLTNAGVYGLAHSVRDQPVDQALIDSMKSHGTWQMAATLARELSMFVYAKPAPFLNDPFFTRSISPDVVAKLKSPQYEKQIASDEDFPRYAPILKTAQQNLKRLVDAGVKYGFGTDAGPPGRFPGVFEQLELQLEVEAGLTPRQAILGATRNAAEFLGASKDLGTLQTGRWADLIVLKQNPLTNIKNTRTIETVWIAGRKVN